MDLIKEGGVYQLLRMERDHTVFYCDDLPLETDGFAGQTLTNKIVRILFDNLVIKIDESPVTICTSTPYSVSCILNDSLNSGKLHVILNFLMPFIYYEL